MPNVKDCPGFETFGADVQQAREAVKMSRRELAEKVGIDPRYLANIELCGTIPSVPVVMQLIRICKLPAERYFNPELLREDSEQRQRTSHKLQLCPEKYLPIVEGVIDGAIKLKDADDEKEDVYQSESELELQFIDQLNKQGYSTVSVPDYDSLIENFKVQFEAFNADKLDKPLTDKEWERILNLMLGKSVFKSAKILRDKFVLEREDGTKVYLSFFDSDHTKNIFQVTHQTTVRSLQVLI